MLTALEGQKKSKKAFSQFIFWTTRKHLTYPEKYYPQNNNILHVVSMIDANALIYWGFSKP